MSRGCATEYVAEFEGVLPRPLGNDGSCHSRGSRLEAGSFSKPPAHCAEQEQAGLIYEAAWVNNPAGVGCMRSRQIDTLRRPNPPLQKEMI